MVLLARIARKRFASNYAYQTLCLDLFSNRSLRVVGCLACRALAFYGYALEFQTSKVDVVFSFSLYTDRSECNEKS